MRSGRQRRGFYSGPAWGSGGGAAFPETPRLLLGKEGFGISGLTVPLAGRWSAGIS